ncbi:MAG: YigZ family protein [Aquitalea sp.]|nr:YigZ family protein [Aquitalea sp.]
MFQLAAPIVAEIDIKKSRFIAHLYPVTNREQAMQHLLELRRRYPDARHYCAVLLVDGDSMLDDDGEPSGTAARPMYKVLMHKNVHNVLAVVVRYFGGIKLGAGGLVRAYTQSLNDAILLAELQPVVLMRHCVVRVDFANESRLRRCCAELSIAVGAACYGEQVELALSVPLDQCQSLQTRLRDLLAGELYFMTDEK